MRYRLQFAQFVANPQEVAAYLVDAEWHAASEGLVQPSCSTEVRTMARVYGSGGVPADQPAAIPLPCLPHCRDTAPLAILPTDRHSPWFPIS